jgi:hypothetical protein
VSFGSVQAAKNRISQKIKKVAELSKVLLKIQNNSRRWISISRDWSAVPHYFRVFRRIHGKHRGKVRFLT